MDSWHKANPLMPLVSTEAVICESERGVDTDFCPDPDCRHAGACADATGTGVHAAAAAAATADDVDVDVAAVAAPGSGCSYNNEVQNCTALQVGYSDSRDFNSGTFVWSGFDYMDGSDLSGGGALGTVKKR